MSLNLMLALCLASLKIIESQHQRHIRILNFQEGYQTELTCQGILLPWDLKNDSRRVTLSFFLIAAVFFL
jgi:hypothetical protein